MMKVVYSEMDTPAGINCRLEAAGHAGYAPAGQDIVCAGASTVMQGLVCLLAGEESARSDAFDEPDGPRLAVQADAPCAEWVQGAFELAMHGVIFGHIYHVIKIDKRIVDADDLISFRLSHRCAEN